MKEGFVVTIRIRPQDAATCVDVVTGQRMVAGMSFAQVVSTAIKVMCEAMRASNLAPRRDVWEVPELVKPFQDFGRLKRDPEAATRKPMADEKQLIHTGAPLMQQGTPAFDRAVKRAQALSEKKVQLLRIGQELSQEEAMELETIGTEIARALSGGPARPSKGGTDDSERE